MQANFVPFGKKMKKNTKTRPRGRPKVVDKERSIEAAMLEYWRDGIRGKSLNEMLKSIGISKPGFYREFENEDGLMAGALERYKESNVAPLLEIVEAGLPFEEVLENAIQWLTENRETPKGCLFTKMRLMRGQLGAKTLNGVEEAESELQEAFRSWYQKGIEEGAVDQNISPEFASLYIGTQFTNVLVQMDLGIPPELIREQANMALAALLKQ